MPVLEADTQRIWRAGDNLISVTVDVGIDGTPVVFVDTDETTEQLRIRLNDERVWPA